MYAEKYPEKTIFRRYRFIAHRGGLPTFCIALCTRIGIQQQSSRYPNPRYYSGRQQCQ